MRILANWRWIAPILAVVVVAGIAVSLLAFRPAPATSATLVRTRSDMNILTPQPLSRTSTDTAQVQHLYDLVHGLKPIPSDAVYHCPIDFGVKYQLSFHATSGALLVATFDPAGCRFLSIGNQGYFTTDAFWSTLESTFGVSEKELQDLPPGM